MKQPIAIFLVTLVVVLSSGCLNPHSPGVVEAAQSEHPAQRNSGHSRNLRSADSRPSQEPHPMQRQEIVRLAKDAATQAGYEVEDYREPDVRFEVTRKDGSWTVFFERKPPTPPGGHFQVWVEKTGKTRVMAGE